MHAFMASGPSPTTVQLLQRERLSLLQYHSPPLLEGSSNRVGYRYSSALP